MLPAMPNSTSPRIELEAHGDFVAWLARSGGTLAVTTYNAGKLALFSASEGELLARVVRLPRPMGLAFDGEHFAVAVRERIVTWRRSAEGSGRFVVDAVHATGRLDVHEMAYDARGLCFANTRYNCLARPSERVRFRRMWSPPFLPEIVPRDCCHLNGVGVHDGRVTMMTAFCTGNGPGAWRAGDRFSSGIVLEAMAGRVVASGLCMPHSPRWHDGQWWLCNSGLGALCTFDPVSGDVRETAALPGFTRGLCFAAGRAIVGLSHIRPEHILDAPPVRERFDQLRSGVWLVDDVSGVNTGALEFVRGGREVFDAAFLPGITSLDLERPSLENPSETPEAK
jgi:uncharacterized protein (TIGR03032 family)